MIRDEKGFLDEIESFLKEKGYKTWREVIPDQCEGWEKPYRVDLVFYNEKYGYIGVEAKYLNTLGQGGIIAQAFEQIKKYRTYTYFKGNLISRWCIAPRFEYREFGDAERTICFIKTFLNYYDVSFLEFKKYSNKDYNRIVIDALTPKSIHIKNGDYNEPI
jgi:hypothetical protein